jgi:DNA polymerase-4
LLAKIAGELQKPDGLQWLLPSVMPDKIAHLSLTDLPGISRATETRLLAAGISTISELYALPPRHARQIWHSVQGERFIRALQGQDIPDPVTKPHSYGHGQVLSPENRSLEGARLVARRLLVKAATRLRRDQYFASHLHVSVKCYQRGHSGYGARIAATQDTFQLLAHFRQFWAQLTPGRPVSVAVMLGQLQPQHNHVADLFEQRTGPGQQTKREQLCAVVDGLNQRYGADTVIYGEKPRHMTPYSGAKIAFGRIPKRREFRD